MEHRLKTGPEYYEAVISGIKTFERRKASRLFEVGHILVLQEYTPNTKAYTGRESRWEVTYIAQGGVGGLADGFVEMAIKPAWGPAGELPTEQGLYWWADEDTPHDEPAPVSVWLDEGLTLFSEESEHRPVSSLPLAQCQDMARDKGWRFCTRFVREVPA